MPKQRPLTHKQVDRNLKSPEVLIARGDISANDKKLLTQLLGRLGLSTRYIPQDRYIDLERQVAMLASREPSQLSERQNENHYSFSQITSPDQFIVREHL